MVNSSFISFRYALYIQKLEDIAHMATLSFVPFKVMEFMSFFKMFDPIKTLLNIYMRMYPGIIVFMFVFYTTLYLGWA